MWIKPLYRNQVHLQAIWSTCTAVQRSPAWAALPDMTQRNNMPPQPPAEGAASLNLSCAWSSILPSNRSSCHQLQLFNKTGRAIRSEPRLSLVTQPEETKRQPITGWPACRLQTSLHLAQTRGDEGRETRRASAGRAGQRGPVWTRSTCC